MRRCTVIALPLLGLAATCHAQELSIPAARLSALDSRALFREERQTRRLMVEESLRRAPTVVDWYLVTSLAYFNNGDGTKSYGFPVELQAVVNQGSTIVSLGYDVYDRVEVDGESQSGHGDPSLTLLHRFYLKGPHKVLGGVAVSVPGGSPLGARHASQVVLGSYSYALAEKTWTRIGVSFIHANEVPQSVDSWGQSAKLSAGHEFEKGQALWASVSRSYRQGLGGASFVAFGFEAPLLTNAWGPFSGVVAGISGSCGISSGGRCDSAQLDITLPFR
jgi:hypothetical protein